MYEARGYYRPQVDCIMFTRDQVPFCAVCQRAIVAVIDLYARRGPSRRCFVDSARLRAAGFELQALSGFRAYGLQRTNA